MKTFLKFILVFCATILCAFSAIANNGGDEKDIAIIYKPTAVDADHLKVQLANLKGETYYLKLKGLDGVSYYSERISNHNGYLKVLDLSKLPNGRYILEISQKDQQLRNIMLMDDDKLWLSQVNVKEQN